MKISTIIFDLGKVLVDYDIPTIMQKLAKRSSLQPEKILQALRKSQNILEYSKGNISSAEFFKRFKKELLFDGSLAELEQIWCDIFTPMEEHIEFARTLSNYYPLAILSNTTDTHVRFLEEHYDFFKYFKEKIYSCEVGFVKPDKEIYELTLQRMNADKIETLFIDDLEENVLVPSRMGWQTIHLRPDVNLRHALLSYDLKGII